MSETCLIPLDDPTTGRLLPKEKKEKGSSIIPKNNKYNSMGHHKQLLQFLGFIWMLTKVGVDQLHLSIKNK